MRALLIPGAAGEDDLAALGDRLARLGVPDVQALAPGSCAEQLAHVAESLAGRTLLVDGSLIVADACLGQLVDDPAVATGALVVDGWPRDAAVPGRGTPVRVGHRRIGSAGSIAHGVTAPNAGFLGALVVDGRDAPAASAALAGAADLARDAAWGGHCLDLALVALVRAQVPVAAVAAVGPAIRGGDPGQREAIGTQLAGLDEARILLERANRPDDGFYSTFVLRRASKPVTALALRLGLTPNQVSLLSLAIGLTAAACFALGTTTTTVAGALLMQACLVVDCVDGEVARFTRSFSALGAWLDASTDRVKEYAAYAGLAAGAAGGGSGLWLLAAVVMIMQTVRHVGDYDFSRVQRVRESWVHARSLADPTDGGAAGAGATLELSAALNRSSRIRWVKKVLHMPIGERWLVLSAGAVLVGPRRTLLLLAFLGLVALTYTTLGRVLRARTWRHPAERSGASLLEPQLGLGPIGDPLWHALLRGRAPFAAAFGWVLPATMRAVELLVAWVVTWRVAPAMAPWLFLWLFVVAFHHYDTLYRALGGARAPRWLVWGGLGWDGRTALVLVSAILGGAASLGGLLTWGSIMLGLLLVVAASAQWVTSLRRPVAAGG